MQQVTIAVGKEKGRPQAAPGAGWIGRPWLGSVVLTRSTICSTFAHGGRSMKAFVLSKRR